MTWIKTVPMAEAGEELRGAIEAQRALYPRRVRAARASHGRRHVGDRRLAQPDPRRAVPRLRHLRRADVARPAADPAAARDDHHAWSRPPTGATIESSRTQSFCVA